MRAGLTRPARARRRRGRSAMATSPAAGSRRALDERRAQFARYKEDVKERGKPFYPYAMFHDTVMSLVVVVGDRRARDGLEVDVVGTASRRRCIRASSARSTRQPADPGTTSFVPRPDWYFYFLFYLLRVFKWPESVFLGTVGVPTICAHPADRAPVLSTGAASGGSPPAGRDRRARSSSSSRWPCSPGRARPRRRRSPPR